MFTPSPYKKSPAGRYDYVVHRQQCTTHSTPYTGSAQHTACGAHAVLWYFEGALGIAALTESIHPQHLQLVGNDGHASHQYSKLWKPNGKEGRVLFQFSATTLLKWMAKFGQSWGSARNAEEQPHWYGDVFHVTNKEERKPNAQHHCKKWHKIKRTALKKIPPRSIKARGLFMHSTTVQARKHWVSSTLYHLLDQTLIDSHLPGHLGWIRVYSRQPQKETFWKSGSFLSKNFNKTLIRHQMSMSGLEST